MCSAIHVRRALGPTDRERAIHAGPSEVWSDAPYPDLLTAAGFVDVVEVDLSEDYLTTARAWFTESAKATPEMEALYGAEEFRQRQREREAAVGVIEDGLLKRSLFEAIAG